LVIGVPSRPNRLIENTFQILDNFSKVVGTHNLRWHISLQPACRTTRQCPEWQLCLQRHRDRHRLRRLPGRSSNQLRTRASHTLQRSSTVLRRLRSGQLARPPELDAELRHALGRQYALVRAAQPAGDDCARSAVKGVSGHTRSHRFADRMGVSR
jgi:hypothetical protein